MAATELMDLKRRKGILIVLYGINNIGKSTQARLLSKELKEQGYDAHYLKYPRYYIEPSGDYLNKILRGRMSITPDETQMWFVLNRYQYQRTLLNRLEDGEVLIAEDYIGTGIAWGMAHGLDKQWLEEINRFLYAEDLGIMLDGKRFMQGKEEEHAHEQDDPLTEKARKSHLKLAKDYSWKVVDANRAIEEIQGDVQKVVIPYLKRKLK